MASVNMVFWAIFRYIKPSDNHLKYGGLSKQRYFDNLRIKFRVNLLIRKCFVEQSIVTA